jgi:hypothetical protein
MVKPQEQHPRGERERAFLDVRLMLAFGVAVDVGNGEDARVWHETSGFLSPKARDLPVAEAAAQKKAAPGGAADKVFGFYGAPGLGPSTSDHRETLIGTVASNDDHLLLSAC